MSKISTISNATRELEVLGNTGLTSAANMASIVRDASLVDSKLATKLSKPASINADLPELLIEAAVSRVPSLDKSLSIGIAESDKQAYWLAKAKLVENPYMTEFLGLHADPAYKRSMDIVRGRIGSNDAEYRQAFKYQMDTRYGFTHNYAWAVPNPEALASIAENGPIIEAFAGTGYWAHLLKKMGVDIVAFDMHGVNLAQNRFHSAARKPWTDMLTGQEELIDKYPNRTLFMSFPPDGEPAAFNALSRYKGNKFVYVGEGEGGITGDAKFHELLAKDWTQIKEISIPNWEASDGPLRDSLIVYRRK